MGVTTAFVGYATAELSAFLPVSGGFVVQAGLFLDKSMAISTGWIWWYSMAVTMPGELTAASSLFAYWRPVSLSASPSTGMALISA
jgi:amino acid transporter